MATFDRDVMMTEDGDRSLARMFECPVCMDRLNDPRILTTCGHHFCRICLEGIANLHPQGAVTCPNCRAVTPINPQSAVADLPRPVMFNALQERMIDAKPKRTSEHLCRPCAKNKVAASHYCFQCRECLCSPCYMKHKEVPVFAGHDTEDLTQVVFCQSHSTQAVTIYCLDCSKMICTKCCVKKHAGHKTDEVKHIAKKRKKEVKKYLEHQRSIDKAEKSISKLRKDASAKEKVVTEMLQNVTMFQDELIKHKAKMDKINELNIGNFKFFITELNTNYPQIQQGIDLSNLDDLEQLSDPQFLVRTRKFEITGNTSTNELPDRPGHVAMPVVDEICNRTLSEINRLFQKLPRGSADAAFIGTHCVTEQGDGSGDFIPKMKQVKPEPKPRHTVDLSLILPAAAKKKLKACGASIKVKRMPAVPQANAVIAGNQPPGTMTSVLSHIRIDGYEDARGSIIINYMFRSGKQGPNHPCPGMPYHGTHRTAFLPDNPEGHQVVGLLKRAFDAKLVFTIRRATTTRMEDHVAWNGIHHKTNLHGGPAKFGYPDPTYLSRVKNELAVRGIITPSCTDMATFGLNFGIN